ncbi:MAG: ShlB/FhaC/HecB family hemolysin secretion/activation protein [Gammaproteobacteria bacterium]|nr:ShlB/FhaC/HecB family hemolysin secretion/activation protein [Gammaproteobacteria bacterium]
MEKCTLLNRYGHLITYLQWACFLFTVLTAKTATAQEQIIPFSYPGKERSDILKNNPFEPKPQPHLQLPVIKKPDPTDKKLSETLQINIKKIQFQGNTEFTQEQLTNVVKDYIGRKVDTLELQQIRIAITQHYISNGYINSGAIIPDQDVTQGILQIKITEGQLTNIIVSNKGRLNNNYISSRIRLDHHQPLDLSKLQERLYLLQQDPRIKRINANLGPGDTRGESILNIAITEEKPYSLALSVNNHRPPSVGEAQARLEFSHINLSGNGDDIKANYSITEGLQNSYISYNWPLSANDTKLNVAYETSDTRIVENITKNANTNIDNESYTATLGATFPLSKTSSQEHIISINLDKRRSTTFLNGKPITFLNSSASNNGDSRITAVRLGQSWLKFKNNQVFSIRHSLSIGLNALNSTINKTNPDSRFTAWLLQLQWAKRYAPSQTQIIFRSDLQRASNQLIPMEKFAVGGSNTVRGYRENQLVRDNGFVASGEIRHPIYKSSSSQQEVQILGFLDYGRAWEKSSEETQTLYSIGIGLKWSWRNRIAAEIVWAQPLKDLENTPDNTLQDDGVQINLVANLL